MKFEFATAGRIVCGAGTAKEAGKIVAELGGRALVVCGKDTHRADWLIRSIQAAGGAARVFSVPGEPTVAIAQAGTLLAIEADCDVVVGLGGGSALDTAKAISALITNRGDLFDHLEVIGRGLPLTQPPVPCVAIPTTAGTGSEVTRNAVLASPEHQLKVSLRSPAMLPRVAIIDPELALGLPRSITASTGCDALVQLIEPFVSLRSNPITDAVCREGLIRAARSLAKVCEYGQNLAAREDMAIASLFGGIALANAGLGAVHGLASPIGGRLDAPHGAVCGILLAPAMTINLKAIRAQGLSTARFDEVAQILTGRRTAPAEDGIQWVQELIDSLSLSRLSQYGLNLAALPTIAEASLKTSGMKSNPVTLTAAECTDILQRAL